MTNEERLQAIYDRLDAILIGPADNAIYEEKESRSINSYLQSIKLLEEMIRREGEHGEHHLHNG